MPSRTVERALAVLPAALVPLAWGFTAAVAGEAVERRPLAIGLGVMVVLFAVFAAQPAMGEGVLSTWRLVILGGLVANVVSLGGLFVDGLAPLAPVAAYAWTVLPVPALVRTGQAVGARRRYLAFAGLSVAGAVVLVAGGLAASAPVGLAGLALVGAGQTGSIVDAVARNGAAPLSDGV